MNTILKTIVGLIAIGVVGVLVYIYFDKEPYKPYNTSPQDKYEWQTYSEHGYTFQYPVSPLATYIHTLDWPPKLEVTTSPFTCTEAGKEWEQAGKTERRAINGHDYCVTKETQGAAGSIYTMYAYAFQKLDKTLILTFSTSAVTCENYDEPKKTECKNERESFSFEPIVDRMAQSIQGTGVTATSTVTTTPPVATSTYSSKKGTVRGTVVLGPTCPVVRYPPDPQCEDKPHQTKIRIQSANTGTLYTSVSTDVDGKYRVSLNAGTYIFTPMGGTMLPRCGSVRVTVIANQTQTVPLSCDTGIR